MTVVPFSIEPLSARGKPLAQAVKKVPWEVSEEPQSLLRHAGYLSTFLKNKTYRRTPLMMMS